ncbi:MAG: hypothetical protein R6U98_26645 [Pirellulaceae bacterium]
MNSAINTTAFDRATDPVLKTLSREQVMQIVDFHADEQLQQRIEVLARKANEGELADEERAEYEGYAHANKFIAVLQAKARRMMDA